MKGRLGRTVSDPEHGGTPVQDEFPLFQRKLPSVAGLRSGSETLAVSGFNAHILRVGVTLNDTSGLASNCLTAFGFRIDPNVVATYRHERPDGGM